ncbi:MAG TPA: hypothetical protein ENK39_04105 [Epsilonproteobacteria bacterium]|nr:hypothetical protein [Campylobacterota bacterium]
MKLGKLLLTLSILLNILYATEHTATLYGSEDNKEIALNELMKELPNIGYSIVKSNKNIQEFYYQKFKEKNVEMISFFGITNLKAMRPLLLQNPDFGAYAPFNLLAYKTLDIEKDDNTWYGHLSADTMLSIIGEKDTKNRNSFTQMIESLDSLIEKKMKPTLHKSLDRSAALPQKGLIKMTLKFDKPDDLEEYIEDLVSDHDGRFSKHNFIIAGFKDFKFEYDDMDLDFEKYDAYWISMLCHFQFSNSIFNRGKPEAGMFAPCTVYFYIPKGKNELHVGYASVSNWITALNFKDKKRIKYMKSIDAEVVETFEEMGFTLDN